ncbi:MAG: hypothetical protein Q9187_000414 [Circinaria calcarea]
MGRNRVATFALFVQACRQSLVVYALTAAAREDGITQLVSYPDYVRSNKAGDRTGFRHIDSNVELLLRGEHGTNIVQSLITLLHDEDADNCTWLVKGFHNHIRDWWESLSERGQNNSSCHTTGISRDMYTKNHEAEFGAYQPMPNTAGGVRITRPDILHGSSERATKPRLAVFPWLCGIREDDGITLDNAQSENLNDISILHRDLASPNLSPSGRPNCYGRLSEPFAAAVKLPASSAIGDSLLGLRSWNDPMVRAERAILLGEDDAKAYALVQKTEERLLQSWRECFQVVVEEERQRFGEKSFFYCHERGLPRPPPTGDENVPEQIKG